MAQTGPYTADYFASIRGDSRRSAARIAPLAMDLLQPASVVDVGCGVGAWAAAFKALGVRDVLGVDGEYCDRGRLEIAPAEFLAADLTRPLALSRRFDLAICLEVAEHLDARHGEQLVATLAALSPAVLFSAAIPHQGGEHHVNEQWPSYWVQKFAAHGFVAFDAFRRRLWSDDGVAWWYAQNLVLMLHRDVAPRVAERLADDERDATTILPLVHPGCTAQLAWQNRALRACIELMRATPEGAVILIVDENRLGELPPLGRTLRTFPQRDGQYAGPPVHSAAAVAAVDDERRRGADFIAFAWPAAWWLDYYGDFAADLRRRGAEVLKSDDWTVFQL
jgi:SAM-dependent methyltransferase